VARTRMGLSDERLAQLARASFEGSGAPTALVTGAVARVEEWLATPE
jgi:adenosine deaminase